MRQPVQQSESLLGQAAELADDFQSVLADADDHRGQQRAGARVTSGGAKRRQRNVGDRVRDRCGAERLSRGAFAVASSGSPSAAATSASTRPASGGSGGTVRPTPTGVSNRAELVGDFGVGAGWRFGPGLQQAPGRIAGTTGSDLPASWPAPERPPAGRPAAADRGSAAREDAASAAAARSCR